MRYNAVDLPICTYSIFNDIQYYHDTVVFTIDFNNGQISPIDQKSTHYYLSKYDAGHGPDHYTDIS